MPPTTAPAPKPMTGARKAAIVMMTLGEEAAAKMFRHLDESEIEQIAREVATLGAVAPTLGEEVLSEFNDMAAAADYVTSGGVEHARDCVGAHCLTRREALCQLTEEARAQEIPHRRWVAVGGGENGILQFGRPVTLVGRSLRSEVEIG